MDRPLDLPSLFPEELLDLFASLGQPAYRAKQVFSAFSRGLSVGEITTLPKALRERLLAEYVDATPNVAEKRVSQIDGTAKYLLRLFDGNAVEGEVTLPDGVNGVFQWKGKAIPLKPGRQPVGL